MSPTAFARFWQIDLTRECFLSYLTKDDLRQLRLVSQDFAVTISPVLFKEVTLEFNATSFSRQARLAALGRIGHYIKTFTFHMPHTDNTFLPPLMDPDTLEELDFQYEPQVHPSNLSPIHCAELGSKFGSWELNDLLVRQYPLLFHAATNTASFMKAFTFMPSLRHLKISCPGQNESQRHRRDIVDYALVSLRTAVEQANPMDLQTLTLGPIHPSATFYLRPEVSIGSLPSSTRVWRRIKSLNVTMKSFDTSRSDAVTDHLKALHTYVSSFVSLENLSFKWLGDLRGPSPLSLHTEPCTSRPSALDYSTCISHDKKPSTKSQGFSSLRPIRLRRLKTMRLENAIFDASQASSFIMTHRKTLYDFGFEHCTLRSGTWDDALAPLTRIAGNDDWRSKQYDSDAASTSTSSSSSSTYASAQSSPRNSQVLRPPPLFTSMPIQPNEIMDVPIMLSPDEEKADMEFVLKDPMWLDKEVKFFDFDNSDGHSLLSSWSRKHKGVDALRRFGARFGIPYSVKESDIAMESVRKLLKGCRVAWH